MMDCPEDGFGAGLDLELAEDVAQMGFDGADAEDEGLGNVFVG